MYYSEIILDTRQLSQKHYGGSRTTVKMREPQLTDSLFMPPSPASKICYFDCADMQGSVTSGWR